MRPVLALLFLALPLVAAPVPKSLKKAPSLDGDWLWETQESNGKVSPAPDSDFRLWRVSGDTLTLIRQNNAARPEPCRLVADEKGGGLRAFEYKVDSNGYHRRGVCELEGDTLRVAFSSSDKAPPAAVKAEGNVSVYTFKRVTDTK